MASKLSSHPNYHLLNEVPNLSPATALSFIIANDEEGWPIWVDFSIGDVVLSRSNRLYKVIGFTLDNEVIVSQHGLDYDPAIKHMTFRPESLRHEPKPEGFMHKEGLVAFA